MPQATHMSEALSRIVKQIDELATLPIGWRYGSGSPPTQDTASRAIVWAAALIDAGFGKISISPLEDNGILLDASTHASVLEISVHGGAFISLLVELDEKPLIDADELTEEDAAVHLREILPLLCDASDSLTRGSGTSRRIGSTALLSPNLRHLAVAAYPLSTRIAQSARAIPYVHISDGSIAGPPLTQRYSLFSTPPSSPSRVA